MTTRVRFGLIGYGLFGTHHAAAIDRAAHADLAAIAVRSVESQGKASTAYPEADVYGDYHRLLDRDDIDVVSVTTPNRLHFEIGRAVLASGKHLLMEKPMALEVAECDELIRLAEQKGKLIAVGHELRLSALWGQVRTMIEQGRIGTPQYVLVELSRFPYRQGSEGWRYDAERVGSWILEEPIHFFDLARWYLGDRGEPVSVYARGNSRHSADAALSDNFSAIINFPEEAYAVVSQTLAAFGHHQTAKVTGTEGTIWAQWSASDARSDRPSFQLQVGLGDQVEEVACAKPAGELLELADEIEAVAECVRHGAPPPCSGQDGRWSTLLCLAAEHSVRTGGLIHLSDFGQR